MGNTKVSSSKVDTTLKFLLFLAILIFVVEYLASMLDARVTHVIDAVGYYRFSLVPFFTTDFWLGMRPIGYPLFIKILDSNPNLVIAVQSLFYLVTWSFFTIYLYRRAQNKLLGFMSGLITLVMVLHPSISAWTHHVLTESLTFTFIPWIYMGLYEFLITKNKKYVLYMQADRRLPKKGKMPNISFTIKENGKVILSRKMKSYGQAVADETAYMMVYYMMATVL